MVTHINALNQRPDEKSPEYIMFDKLMTDEMVDTVLKMELRVPIYIDEIARRIDKSIEYTAKLINEMAHVGIIEYDPDENGVDRVQVPVFVPGSMELSAMDYWRTDENPQLAYAFPNTYRISRKGFPNIFRLPPAWSACFPSRKPLKTIRKRHRLNKSPIGWKNMLLPLRSLLVNVVIRVA
jgi:hypothetical protein